MTTLHTILAEQKNTFLQLLYLRSSGAYHYGYTIHGVDYYIPDDETESIIAADFETCVAVLTDFTEIADFEDVGSQQSEYSYIMFRGVLIEKS